MSRFAGKVALVTGGRSGIGQACARALAEGGVRAKNQKDVVDKVAAALLLQSYLDSR